MNVLESTTAKTYGKTFSKYKKSDFEKFLYPFYERFRKNNIPLSLFNGVDCLDAGCGGGRGSIFMAANGAKSVTGIDFSKENIATCRRFAKEYRYKNCSFHETTLLDIPFADESFDIIFCNGVLMHTKDPSKVLQELSRVLKKGGTMWIYVYGSGGIYWYVTDWIRKYLSVNNISMDTCMKYMQEWGDPIGIIAEKMDDWYVGYRVMYTDHDFRKSLGSVGFEVHRCMRGMVYDTSERIATHPTDSENAMMGEGDLRYLCHKTKDPDKKFVPLPSGGSEYHYPVELSLLDAPLLSIEQSLGEIKTVNPEYYGKYVVLAMKDIHEVVRGEQHSGSEYDIKKIISRINEISGNMAVI